MIDQHEITRGYLTSWFVIDLVTCIPISYVPTPGNIYYAQFRPKRWWKMGISLCMHIPRSRYLPTSKVPIAIGSEDYEAVMDFVDSIEDMEDVVEVFSNAEFS